MGMELYFSINYELLMVLQPSRHNFFWGKKSCFEFATYQPFKIVIKYYSFSLEGLPKVCICENFYFTYVIFCHTTLKQG